MWIATKWLVIIIICCNIIFQKKVGRLILINYTSTGTILTFTYPHK